MSMSQQLNVQLPHFEGPLALLIYLIRKDEMDIMDIKIHEITAQYLDYIKLMKELDVEVAGEFIAMAATLIHIKSRMLLPQYDENGEIVETEDPRKELVQKLMEYQKYQEASKLLADRPWVGRDIFLRGMREKLDVQDDSVEIEDNGLFSLIAAYRKALKTLHKRVHKVAAKAQSIASRILEMKSRLIVGARIVMSDLIAGSEDRARATLITFLSLLELGRMGFVSLSQSEVYSDIWVVAKREIEDAAISRVEEFDNLNAGLVADALAETPSAPETDEALLASFEDSGEQLGLTLEADTTEGMEVSLDGVDLATDEEILAAEQELATDSQARLTPEEGESSHG